MMMNHSTRPVMSQVGRLTPARNARAELGGWATIQVVMEHVLVNKQRRKHKLLLREKDGGRTLGVGVGKADFDAANWVRTLYPMPRPQTHHLILEAVNRLGGKCLYGAITGLVGRHYSAKLVLERGGQQFDLEGRSSDVVNVALRAKVPIFADESLLSSESDFAREHDFGDQGTEGGTSQQAE